MNKGSTDKVMKQSKQIVARLKRPDVTVSALMREYRCGYKNIKAAILTQMSKAQYRRLAKKKLARGGVHTRFKPGMESWNKGKKGWSAPGTERTRFRKGHLPHNHKHTGTITIYNDKCGKQFRWIKVSGLMQGVHKWIPYARYLYEKENGPLPKGIFVVHKDGDTLNDDPGNFQAVTRAGHLALQEARDPLMVKKCRRRSAAASKRRHAKNRKIKVLLVKKQKKAIELQAAAQIKLNSLRVKALKQSPGHWECTGCGFDIYETDPPSRCPKCVGVSGFKSIVIKRRLAV